MKQTDRAPADGRAIRPWMPALVGMAAVLAHWAASFSHSNLLWGLNHYFFLGRGWTLAAVLAGCLLCLPRVWTWGTSLAGRLRRGGIFVRRHALNDVVIAALAALVFWLLRTPYHFLGDGRMMIRLLEQGNWYRPTELLDRWLHHVTLELTRPAWNWDAATVYAALSVVAGFLYVLAALRLGGLLRHKVFVAGALVTLGIVQLFCGYAEGYSFAAAAILGYITLALEYLAGRRRLAWAGAALLVGVAMHSAALFLAPSLVYLAAARREKEKTSAAGRWLIGGAFLAAIAGLAVLALTHKTAGPQPLLLLPLFRDPVGQYALFSWKHAADFLNEQVLLSPLAWIGGVALAIAWARDRALRSSPRFRFLAAAAVFPLVFNMILRPALGGSRDWDLWSLGSLPYVVAVVSWLAASLAKRPDLRFAAYVLVVVNFFHVLPWVAVNHSAERSLDRFKRMAESNPLWPVTKMASAQSELGHFYIEQERSGDALKHLERAVALDPTWPHYWDALGVAYIGLKRFDDAVAPLQKAIELDPRDGTAYNNLGRAYLVLGRLNEAEHALARAIELNPGGGPAYFNLGNLYATRGEIDRAIEAYGQAVRVWSFVPEYWQAYARALEQAGRTGEARDAMRRAAELGR
ncbi:MAG: tetratricopeptide repeat protein [bacterium]